MDLGCSLSTDGLVPVSSDPNVLIPSLFSLDSEPSKRRGLFKSSFSKHGRSIVVEEDDEYWSRLKTARGDPMLTSTSKAETCLPRSGSHSLFPDGEQMLNFSSWKSDALVLNNHWNSPSFNYPSSSSGSSTYPTLRNAGTCSGNPTLNMHGAVSGIRGPFTTSQWLELEQQTLIYKYIDAKVPLPSNLLMAIRRSINPSGFSSFIAGSYRPAGTLGWGNFHVGFPGSADPEPGRCRRTDGKKWRCSRDAVVDQKYCERHMNRGRHRSRKRVEGHNGHAAKAAVPGAITSSQSTSAVSCGGSSNNPAVAQQQSKNLQPSLMEPSSLQQDRLLMNRDSTSEQKQNSKGLSLLGDVNLKSTGTLLPMAKQVNPFEEKPTRVDLGLISTDSLRNNSEGNCSSENLSFVFYNSEMNDQHTPSHPFRHFIDDWSKTPSDVMEKKQSNRTELSISIPISSDFSSSSSSTNQDKLSFSPLRLSSEFNPMNDGSQRGLSWIPISWEPTIGGPLGEVLTNTSTTTTKDVSSNLSASSLNLMTDGWNSKARFESSPTGVLHESGFGSLSSSAGSSPRAENHKAHESDDLLGSTFVNLLTNPSL